MYSDMECMVLPEYTCSKLESFKSKKHQRGMSIVEVMISIGIMSIVIAGVTTMMSNQYKESKALQESIAKMDLERSLVTSLNNGAICTFILNDSSQGATAPVPNRDVDTFNSAAVTVNTPLTIKIKNLLASASASSPSLARAGEKASPLSSSLLVKEMKFLIRPNHPPDVFLADFQVDFDNTSLVRPLKSILIKNIQIATDSSTPLNAKKIIGCSGWGEPRAQRFIFTTSSTWTVPVGTRKAFVTMAGGGGSGLGWRISNMVQTGHSGGYVFSHPVNLVPGEEIEIIVGVGGIGYPTIRTNEVVAAMGPPYYVHTNPTNDDGLGGHPGSSSKIVSPSAGVLLECAGGSGAIVNGVDAYSGSVVAGNVAGAVTGSGNPSLPSPTAASRKAAGALAIPNGPGTCGDSQYGIGNRGENQYGVSSGTYAGGTTPFGYGSGGSVGRSGCYVNQTLVGTCTSPADGRDGVVFIDVW